MEKITEGYSRCFKVAVDTKLYNLPYYEIEQWDKVLNPVLLRIFQDIKIIGVPLYPILPISPTQFIHFANPFNRVGIQIIYETSIKEAVERKVSLLESQGWTIYRIQAKKSFYTFEQYCDFKKIDFHNLDRHNQFQFCKKNKERNDYCLLYYMKVAHFQENFEPYIVH